MRIQPAITEDGSIIYVNWDKSKITKHSLDNGKHYAAYLDKDCTQFYWWLKRKEILKLHLKVTIAI